MIRQSRVPRRGKHTQDELRELILAAATALIKERGLDGLSAREVARRIEYSPGTLYNVFKDRDDIILAIESRLLDDLDAHLDSVETNGDARRHVMALANAYLAFTHNNANLWNILFEHRLGKGRKSPEWYQGKIDALMARIETAIGPLLGDGSGEGTERSARVLWASVHGITSLSVAGKLSNITNEGAKILVEDLVATYLDGLHAGGTPPPPKMKKPARRRS